MPPSPDKVWLLANAVKTAIEEGYADAGVSLPDRRFVAGGQPAWDCELLAVQVEQQYSHAGNIVTQQLEPQGRAAGFSLRAITVAIHLIRCSPTVDAEGNEVTLPSVQDEEAYAETVLTDSVLLASSIVAAQRAGDLPGCSGVALDTWTNVTQNGGLGGGIQRMRLGL